MRRLDPDYKGFRGHAVEPTRPGNTPLERAMCRVCGRTRNVARGIAVEQGENFVCSVCIEEGREPEAAKPQPEE